MSEIPTTPPHQAQHPEIVKALNQLKTALKVLLSILEDRVHTARVGVAQDVLHKKFLDGCKNLSHNITRLVLSCHGGEPLPENCVPFMEMTEKAALFLVQSIHTILIELDLLEVVQNEFVSKMRTIFSSIERLCDAIAAKSDNDVLASATGPIYQTIDDLRNWNFNNQVFAADITKENSLILKDVVIEIKEVLKADAESEEPVLKEEEKQSVALVIKLISGAGTLLQTLAVCIRQMDLGEDYIDWLNHLVKQADLFVEMSDDLTGSLYSLEEQDQLIDRYTRLSEASLEMIQFCKENINDSAPEKFFPTIDKIESIIAQMEVPTQQ
eukprot:TRINITY_DN1522_c0_g1_i1.p1 TRINITY_DN1522_c0_g1~~TRINITY_DN1522_c0_g1_i1.p1  ORF type:complete len:342 (-),score=71.58 TRINITY_DN1522_c0_g1_i1:3-980(-)